MARRQLLKAGKIPEEWKSQTARLRQKDRDARWRVDFAKAKPKEDKEPQIDIAIRWRKAFRRTTKEKCTVAKVPQIKYASNTLFKNSRRSIFSMQVILLAGGLGTRLSEETSIRPKPLVEIGGRPIIWHIMKIYAAHGLREFIVCTGYKGNLIKEFFANYTLNMSDVTFDMGAGRITTHRNAAEDWRVTLVDTGEATMTGGRLRRVLPLIRGDAFCMTYGDGVADVDITRSIAFHRAHGREATVTAVYPPRRFGILEIEGDRVTSFREKPVGEGGFINGGFFVLSPAVGRLLRDDLEVWEQSPLHQLALENELRAFRHEGFFQPMDTLRDRTYLEELWSNGRPPWKVWE